jgi:predicted O-linked N-acetylglucosamine transferase (SPINDLY family)
MSQMTVQQVLTRALEQERAGRVAEARELIRQIRQTLVARPDALQSLAIILGQNGWIDQAIEVLADAARLAPENASIQMNLGYAFHQIGRLDEAATAFRRAIVLAPSDPMPHFGLANALADSDRREDAIASYQRVIELAPGLAAAHTNLGLTYQRLGLMDEAIAAHRAALKIEPSMPEAWSHLGTAVRLSGDARDSIESYRRAVDLNPAEPTFYDNLLFALYQAEGIAPETIVREHRVWAERFAAPLASRIPRHPNDRSRDRPLRVGYVSPDLRDHPVGAFLLPILQAHDPRKVHAVCYCDSLVDDAVTAQLRAAAEWRKVAKLDNQRLAEMIIADRIDILVDLAQHSADNRLTLFAQKPAPVQITYLGYPGTTGLQTFDARLSDPHLDPPGQTERFYTEPTVRLPNTYWCYRPTEEVAIELQPPALRNGYVTFGCLNNMAKVSPGCLRAWQEILRRVPKSKLTLTAPHGAHRARIIQSFYDAGIEPTRLDLIKRLPFRDYLAQYNRIDIALDPFPWNGGTTTCHALWMGAPVVTLAGQLAVQRAGVSLLSNVGLTEFIATTTEEYISLAVQLATDAQRQATLRATLRNRMAASPLMDVPQFVRNLEDIYRELWLRWCNSGD